MTPRTNPSGYAVRLPDPVRYPPLQGRVEADTVIIGGGLAGLNTALSLLEHGSRDVLLLESETLGFGASGRNGGFVFGGYSLGEAALLRKAGAARARRLYRRSVDAVGHIRQRIARYQIDCELSDEGVIWANWFRNPAILRSRQQLLAQHYDCHWQWLPQAQLRDLLHSERYHDGLFEPEAMHLDPLAYVRGLGATICRLGGRVHEHSKAVAMARNGDKWNVKCANGHIKCKNVVLAGGAYLHALWPPVERAALPIATYAMLSEPLGTRLDDAICTPAAVYDSRFAFDYYRVLADRRLLWGGRISVRDRPARDVQRLLQRDVRRVYPQLGHVAITRAWSGLMSYARHAMPQIGSDGRGLYWAQAFGGHGLAPTTVAGEVLAAALHGDESGLAEFAPFGLSRTFGRAGLLAAQAQYSALQSLDRSRSKLERCMPQR